MTTANHVNLNGRRFPALFLCSLTSLHIFQYTSIMKIFTLSVLVFLSFTREVLSQHQYGITAFGTDLITADQLREDHRETLDVLLALYLNDLEQYHVQRSQLGDLLVTDPAFAYVNVFLFKSYSGRFDFIIDFVENKDVSVRMNFRTVSEEELADPDDLIAKWYEYQTISTVLFYDGKITDIDCPVIHCTWSFNHPDLAPFLEYFAENAPKHREELIKLLNHSNSPKYRAAAAFLLVHANIDPNMLVDILTPSVRDPDNLVRNNSMRVLYYIARANPQANIDIPSVIDGLDYPSFTDRNKALVILRSLPLDNLSEAQEDRLIPILLEILQKKDAHNYKNAHTVIKKITMQVYSSSDIAQWRNWAKYRKDK